jgi:hypothetical protein
VESGIVPSIDEFTINQFLDLALAQHSVTNVEARVLPHEGLVHVKRLEKPVVRFTSDFELQSA